MRGGPRVDAQACMEHVRDLYAKGMSTQAMADQSGLNDRTIRGYLNGYLAIGNGQRRPIKNAMVETAEKILAIQFKVDHPLTDFRPDLLRGLRESKGLSRATLGKAAGICAETIQYWETGRNLPTRKKNIDAVLAVLGAEWEHVSRQSAEVEDDTYSMIFSEGTVDPENDCINDYPCHVCGGIFRSRTMLAQHPHPAKAKVSA